MTRGWVLCSVLGLALVAGGGCRKGEGSGEGAGQGSAMGSGQAAGEAPVPVDARGRYRLPRKMPSQYACGGHLDCVASRLRPGHCCLTECPETRVAGSQRWFAVLREVHERQCGAWLKAHPHACTYPKCESRGRPEARCVRGRCVVQYRNR